MMFEYIKYYSSVLDKTFCNDVIEKFNKRLDSSVKREIQNHLAFSEINICTPEWSSEKDYVYGQMAKVVESYKHSVVHDSLMWPAKHGWEEIRLKKYVANEGSFNDHVDVGDYPSARRFLSMLIYLNDVEDGGKTIFYNRDKQIDIIPVQGSVIVFPPLWLFPHRGEMPKSNDKYIMSTYLHYL
jgi:hypothetical protein